MLEDERETEREKEGEAQLATGDSARAIPGESAAEGREAGMPARKTVESERGAERLMEAIELFEKCKVHKGPFLDDVHIEHGRCLNTLSRPSVRKLRTLYPNQCGRADVI